MSNKLFYWIALLIGIVSCSKDEGINTNDHFFLENAGAVMPIFVRGKVASNVFVIYLHGGPGGSSLEAYQHKDSPFTKLQSEYAMVYWEQRCAGSAQGECSNLTLSQYTEDLQKLIALLKNKYAADIRIFLVGHSWGGSLGINYLSTTNNSSNIKGWIEVGGGHNVPAIVELEREMVSEVGNRQIAKGINTLDWQNKIEEANALDLSKVEDLYEMNRIAVQAEGLMRNADSVNAKIANTWANDYFFSPIDNASANNNLSASFEGMKNELAVLNLSDKLPQITVPTLMIWGKYDFRVPPKFAETEFNRYGSNKKSLVLLENSAHFVQWNEPDRFYNLVRVFIEENK
jgi:pimeloyl-ACP methyl ester carboxylesterase